MNLKSYLRGIGLGMIVTACVLHFTFGAKAAKPMSDEQIKAEARKLGMIENTVLSVQPEGTVETDNTGSTEESDGASSGEQEIADAGNQDNNPETPGNEEAAQPHGEDPEVNPDTKQEATPEADTEDNQDSKTDTTGETKPEGTQDTKPDTVPEEQTSVKPQDDTKPGETSTEAEEGDRTNHVTPSGKTVKIQIVKGDSSNAVAEKLFAAGVIDNAYDFDRYLCENKLDKNMIVGEFEIKIGTSYKDLARLLSSATPEE